MVLPRETGDIVLLKLSSLGLVAGGVRRHYFARQVELVYRLVTGAAFANNDDPGLFTLGAGVEELELGIGDTAIVGIHLGRFGTVAVADELDESLAGVDLLPQPPSQLAVAGGKIILRDGIEPEGAHSGGDILTGGPQLLADGGKEKTWAVHAVSASKVQSFLCQGHSTSS